MHAVDTNVVVRYLIGDDAAQAAKARALIGTVPVFVSRTVLLEVEWVLRAAYEVPPARIIAAMRAFAGLPEVVIEDAAAVARAMGWAEGGMDFADALHLAGADACSDFLTFDRRFIRSASQVSGVSVRAP